MEETRNYQGLFLSIKELANPPGKQNSIMIPLGDINTKQAELLIEDVRRIFPRFEPLSDAERYCSGNTKTQIMFFEMGVGSPYLRRLPIDCFPVELKLVFIDETNSSEYHNELERGHRLAFCEDRSDPLVFHTVNTTIYPEKYHLVPYDIATHVLYQRQAILTHDLVDSSENRNSVSKGIYLRITELANKPERRTSLTIPLENVSKRTAEVIIEEIRKQFPRFDSWTGIDFAPMKELEQTIETHVWYAVKKVECICFDEIPVNLEIIDISKEPDPEDILKEVQRSKLKLATWGKPGLEAARISQEFGDMALGNGLSIKGTTYGRIFLIPVYIVELVCDYIGKIRVSFPATMDSSNLTDSKNRDDSLPGNSDPLENFAQSHKVPDSPEQKRLYIDDKGQIIFEGKILSLTGDGEIYLKALIRAGNRVFVSGTEIDIAQVKRARESLPADIQILIEAKPGKGSRLILD